MTCGSIAYLQIAGIEENQGLDIRLYICSAGTPCMRTCRHFCGTKATIEATLKMVPASHHTRGGRQTMWLQHSSRDNQHFRCNEDKYYK